MELHVDQRRPYPLFTNCKIHEVASNCCFKIKKISTHISMVPLDLRSTSTTASSLYCAQLCLNMCPPPHPHTHTSASSPPICLPMTAASYVVYYGGRQRCPLHLHHIAPSAMEVSFAGPSSMEHSSAAAPSAFARSHQWLLQL
jgi:hypothetical protein